MTAWFHDPRAAVREVSSGKGACLNRMAAVVQEMIFADKSGAMFTADPVRKMRIAPQRTAIVHDPGRGKREIDLAEDRARNVFSPAGNWNVSWGWAFDSREVLQDAAGYRMVHSR